ncbi:hypothetical protein AC578_5144 [Pseudocercospora eumusae]|uniref:Peptidase M48 domain-containing protein n=1 Tax=Pseudocercospora eumusae TaxID=321146 RepID=A0A139HMV6_9PEZI|nr:hypothetical protein AC578_5144 [Pseudocercospora eumusae]
MLAKRIMLAPRPIELLRSTNTRSFTTSRRPLSPLNFRSNRIPINVSRTSTSATRLQYNPQRPWQDIWRKGQQRDYRRQAFNYQRYQTSKGLLLRWASSPTFYYQVAGLSGVAATVYVYNLETVDVSGRRRFNIISPDMEKSMAEGQSEQVLQQYGPMVMSERSKEHRQVQRVLRRLMPHSGLEGEQWEVHVIDSDEKNAFVIPGGKVFVFRGILDICQGDDGLAAVLGHEIAHNVAHHAAERMSRMSILTATAVLADALIGVDFGLVRLVNHLVFDLPGSRKEEEEADYIGLLMMADSCYNPEAAMGVWQRMEVYEKSMGGAPPQFLSTHPSSHARLEKIRDWLPKAQQKLEDGNCGTTGMYAQGFGSTMQDFARWG